ncbi:MAG: PLP-dependent aminotransferase family protein [Desulfovibrionaceae bacterium]
MPSFASRLATVHRSFIREILKVTADPEIISFAGGLPNPAMFPVREMAEASARMLQAEGERALQYSTTEGDPELRAWIADRYRQRFGLAVDPDLILVTSGSQQGLDLVGKVFLDAGDRVAIERPGYLGAIQAFSVFQPEFVTVRLTETGPDLDELERVMAETKPKLFYAVPNFQNPSGMSYGLEARREVARLCLKYDVLFLEDDPYGELRFRGEHLPPVYGFTEGRSVLMGSFSKIAAPGFRLGWILAPAEIHDKLVVVKQAADLHTSTFVQRVLAEFLRTASMDAHVERIRRCYGMHRDHMVAAVRREFPASVACTEPDGGMFLWATLPGGLSAMDLLDEAVRRKVAFVPGRPFYVDGGGEGSLRLNFSNASPEGIDEGIGRLGEAVKGLLARRAK